MLAQHSDRVKHGGGTTGGAYMGVARVRDGAPLRRIDIKVCHCRVWPQYNSDIHV